MLSYYCSQFPVVELNFTFYRLPTSEMLRRMAQQTPDGFQFVVKLPRSLSHEENPADLVPFQQAIGELHARRRLLGLLCQLPQSSRFAVTRLKWLERLAAEFGGQKLAVEFRHRSWLREDVPLWLQERQLDLVSVDVPDIPALYPRGLVRSNRRLYIRFHSRNSANWYRSDKERYDYDYSDEVLLEWVRMIGESAADADEVLLLFNNCQRGHAATNAARIRQMFSALGAKFEITASSPSTDSSESLPLFRAGR
jgi:uncharacterized protein YecE (DUF72 family)